jgi:phage shock protein A
MKTAIDETKQAVHDKLKSQLRLAQAALDLLKARAESAKASDDLKLIAKLLLSKQTLDLLLNQLKKSRESTYEQVKTDIESRVAQLEQSVDAIKAKFKAA